MAVLAGDANQTTGVVSAATGTLSGSSGSSTAFANTSRAPIRFDVWGTFGSATVKPQYSPDNGTTWIDYNIDITGATVSLTANGGIPMLNVVQGDLLRATFTGGTGTSVTYRFVEMIRK